MGLLNTYICFWHQTNEIRLLDVFVATESGAVYSKMMKTFGLENPHLNGV